MQSRKRNFDSATPPKAKLEYYFTTAEQREEHRNKRFKQLRESRNTEVEQAGRILIAHRTDGRNRANGALFDHRVLQEITQTKTVVTWDKTDKKKSVNWLQDYITSLPYQLKFGVELADTTSGIMHSLFIPGVSSDNYNHPTAYYQRVKYEFSLLKQAFQKGMPVLAVCGGAWELWRFCHLISEELTQKFRLIPDEKKRAKEEAINAKTQVRFFSDPNEYSQAYDTAVESAEEEILQNRTRFLRTVSEHGYRRMPGLSATDGGVTHNIQMHRIRLQREALFLMAAMQIKNINDRPAVNSVHWQACDERLIPNSIHVSAHAEQDHELAPYRNKEEGNKWLPEQNSIEAFELKYGAPMLGIQWHPEAYFEKNEGKKTPAEQVNCEQQRRILQYINRAGHTYQMKLKLVCEIKNIGLGMINWRQKHLNALGLIKPQKGYLIFANSSLKDGRWFYYPRVRAQPHLPMTHTREAKQLAIQTTIPLVEKYLCSKIGFYEGNSKISTKKANTKRSADFFISANTQKEQPVSVQILK